MNDTAPLMLYVGAGNTGAFNTGQSNTISLDADYPNCIKNPNNFLNRSRGAIGAYFDDTVTPDGLGKGMICGGNVGAFW